MRWWIKSIHFLQSDQELHRDAALPEQIQGQYFSKGHCFTAMAQGSIPGHFTFFFNGEKDNISWVNFMFRIFGMAL